MTGHPDRPYAVTERQGCGPDCALCLQSCYCYRDEYGEEAYQQAWAALFADYDQLDAEQQTARLS